MPKAQETGGIWGYAPLGNFSGWGNENKEKSQLGDPDRQSLYMIKHYSKLKQFTVHRQLYQWLKITVKHLKVPIHLKTQGMPQTSWCAAGDVLSLTSDLCAWEYEVVSSGLVLWELLIVSGMEVIDVSR